MIKLSEIYIALRETIEQACGEAGLKAPIYAGDLSEPIVRPSLQIDLAGEETVVDSTHLAARKLTVHLFFFPSETDRWRDEHYAMRDVLREALYDGLMVGTFFLPSETGILLESRDGILCSEIIYDWIEELPSHDTGELMDSLDLDIYT